MHVEQEQWGRVFKAMVEGVAEIDLLWLKTHEVPPLYEAGVIHRAATVEEFSTIPNLLARGWGSSADLTAWRIAELLFDALQGRIKTELGQSAATARVEWWRTSTGWNYTFMVRHASGIVENVVTELGNLGPEVAEHRRARARKELGWPI